MWQRLRRCITPTITLITSTVQKEDVSCAKRFICIQIENKGYFTSGVHRLITGYMTRPVIHHVMMDERSWLNMIRLTEEHKELMGRIYAWYHFDRIWHKLRWKYFSFWSHTRNEVGQKNRVVFTVMTMVKEWRYKLLLIPKPGSFRLLWH